DAAEQPPEAEKPAARELSPLELADAARRYEAWLRAIPDDDLPRSGHGGDAKTYNHARVGVNDFCVPRGVAQEIYARVVDERLRVLGDAWDAAGLAYKFEKAEAAGPDPRFPRGCKLNAKPDAAAETPAAWSDPDRLATEFLCTRSVVCVKDSTFV